MTRRRIRIAAPYGSSVIFFGGSVIRVPSTALAGIRLTRQRKTSVSLPAMAGFFKPNRGLRGMRFLSRSCLLRVAAAFAEQFLFPCQRVRGDGIEMVVLRGPIQGRADAV